MSVVPDHEPNSPPGEAFVRQIRAVDAPFDVAVTGSSAQLVDTKAALFDRLPLALAIIAGITFVLLFLLFGSVVIPLKALVLNVLSLSATFGAMVWIFQEGHLAGPLDFTATGTLDATTPILMFCVAFGLSMDYEVFLLSRIKEEHDAGADDRRAVALGLERTGRIVTAAALLISVVFLAFGTSEVSFIKLFGIGLTLAVLMDAFLIRGTLVPAFMRLAGRANWWAPGPLRRLHERFGIGEHVDLDGRRDDLAGPRPDPRPVAVAPAPWPPARGRRPPAPRRPAVSPDRPRARRGEGDRLRDEILEAAEALLVETGSEDAVSIRAVADRVGVTPPSIYRHFADKGTLLFEVCDRQFDRFHEYLDAKRSGHADPVEALLASGRAYVEFGLTYPEHYRIMFMGRSDLTPEQYQDHVLAEQASFMALVESVQDCVDAGRLDRDAFETATCCGPPCTASRRC